MQLHSLSNEQTTDRPPGRQRRGLIAVLVTLVTALLVLVVLAVTLPDGHPGLAKTHASTPAAATSTVPATVWTDPADAAHQAFTPLKLVIPKMHLDAKVIGVGAKSDGAMATPVCQSAADPVCGEVYWWSPGAVPGQPGNTVIAGHINRPDASPASFWFLYQLSAGDTMQITVANGDVLTYVVASTSVVTAYATGANNPVLNAIFGPATSQNLNLITCVGDWDGKTFDHRLVVQARLVGTTPYPTK
ncbi:MAG TPA: class F sortase [Ktedonobacterales bacterium]|nr:class F sortase [Ktedonobacterales bacterium]